MRLEPQDLARYLMWGGIVCAPLGFLLVAVFVQVIAMDDSPELTSASPDAIARFRAYQDRIQFYSAMRDTGESLVLVSIAFTLASFAVSRVAPAAQPRAPAPPAILSGPAIEEEVAATPSPPPSTSASTRDVLKRLKKG